MFASFYYNLVGLKVRMHLLPCRALQKHSSNHNGDGLGRTPIIILFPDLPISKPSGIGTSGKLKSMLPISPAIYNSGIIYIFHGYHSISDKNSTSQ